MKRLFCLVGLISTFNALEAGANICENWQQNCSGAGQVNPAFLKILNTTGSCTAAGDYGCDLSYLQASDINLAPGVKLTDLSGANLTCANFSNSPNNPSLVDEPNNMIVYDLKNVKFGTSGGVGANLTDACLSRTNLTNASFNGANLSGADLSGSTAQNVDFSNAALYAANMTNGDFSNSIFKGAGFSQANLEGSLFQGADFTELSEGLLVRNPKGININQPLDLRTAQNITKTANNGFANANMTGVNLSGLDLEGIQFNMTNLTNANFSNTKNTLPAIADGTNTIQGVNLSFVDLSNQTVYPIPGGFPGIVLAGANLSNTKLQNLNLDSASFYFNRCATNENCQNLGANLDNADFTGSTLTNVKDLYLAQNLNTANFTNLKGIGPDAFNGPTQGRSTDNMTLLDMKNAKFQGANLSGAGLAFMDLTGANFEGANLTNGQFPYSTFTNANFQNANLTGVNSFSNFNGANFAGATLANCSVFNNNKNLCPKGAHGCCIDANNVNN